MVPHQLLKSKIRFTSGDPDGLKRSSEPVSKKSNQFHFYEREKTFAKHIALRFSLITSVANELDFNHSQPQRPPLATKCPIYL